MASVPVPNFSTSFTSVSPRQPIPSSPSSASTNHTYLMPLTPTKDRQKDVDSYRPKIIRTLGQKPAVLVSASVTYVGDNQIYAFGGFDQYTDEVYNHVLRLDLDTKQWSLVDNYGDIPGVRMGHTATLWQGNKVLIFGGENEHRSYLSDVIIFDVQTAHWHQPEIHGTLPRGRARHSAVIHDDRLFVIGGLSGSDNNQILDDFCFLDLKTWTWSKAWRFIARFDHTSWIWNDRLWVFGGLTEGMEHVADLWSLDLRQSPYFASHQGISSADVRSPEPGNTRRVSQYATPTPQPGSSSGYAANSSSVQVTLAQQNSSRRLPMAPGSISSVQFVHGQHIPTQAVGRHFHAYSSGFLLDFTTPHAAGVSLDANLCALDLEAMRWERLAKSKDLFQSTYRWHYCAMDPEGVQVWLLGCLADATTAGMNNSNEYLSEVLYIDLREMALLGNLMGSTSRADVSRMPISDSQASSHLTGIGADLARMFDRPPEAGSGVDFIITAGGEGDVEDDFEELEDQTASATQEMQQIRKIHVHRLILEARWPHFARMIASQMAEFHSRKLHVPEPYAVVRSFLLYLYTDSILPTPDGDFSLHDVAGMLVMSDCYEMPRLRLLCRNRLARELDVEHAAVIWERAGQAGEHWLKRKAAKFCMTHWGYVVRTAGFRNLKKSCLLELSQEVSIESRIVSLEDLEAAR